MGITSVTGHAKIWFDESVFKHKKSTFFGPVRVNDFVNVAFALPEPETEHGKWSIQC